jgi:hypothetical protein
MHFCTSYTSLARVVDSFVSCMRVNKRHSFMLYIFCLVFVVHSKQSLNICVLHLCYFLYCLKFAGSFIWFLLFNYVQNIFSWRGLRSYRIWEALPHFLPIGTWYLDGSSNGSWLYEHFSSFLWVSMNIGYQVFMCISSNTFHAQYLFLWCQWVCFVPALFFTYMCKLITWWVTWYLSFAGARDCRFGSLDLVDSSIISSLSVAHKICTSCP